jgi:hypothetical protein
LPSRILLSKPLLEPFVISAILPSIGCKTAERPGASQPDPAASAGAGKAAAPAPKPQNCSDCVAVTVENFPRAETDLYFNNFVKDGAFGKYTHNRTPTPIDKQMLSA